jgi:hypothetical protein
MMNARLTGFRRWETQPWEIYLYSETTCEHSVKLELPDYQARKLLKGFGVDPDIKLRVEIVIEEDVCKLGEGK